jgi:predicted dehydrogenase
MEKAMEIVGEHQPKSCTFPPDLLDHKDLDAIFVETPPHLHREQVVDAWKTGHHCSAAKPLALRRIGAPKGIYLRIRQSSRLRMEW